MAKAGPTVHAIPRMCSFVVTPPTRLGHEDRRLRQRNDILSPQYAPETTAPAAIVSDTPRMGAIPTKATPMVPAVVHELPVIEPTRAQMAATATKKIDGRSTSMP